MLTIFKGKSDQQMQTPKWRRCRNYRIFQNTSYSEGSYSKGEHSQNEQKEIEGMPKNQVETFELIDTITELESPLEHLKSRTEMRKKRTNELEVQSKKIIQSGKHRRKKNVW